MQAALNFTATILAEENLAASLAGIAEEAAFLAAAMAFASARNATFPPDIASRVQQPDVIGLTRFAPPLLGGSTLPPRHWLPVAVATDPEGTAVDWAWLGPEPLRASFYEDDIRRALALPFNRAFRYRTRLNDLIAQYGDLDSLKPNGFIFHMSRCGSTLCAQMLAALPDSIVISEAAPIDMVLQLGRAGDPDVAAQALRAIVAAFGRRRAGHERRYVLKLDAWHALALPIFRRAFPDVPWVFLYRDPVEVLASQMLQRGMQMVPQYFPPSFYSIADAANAPDEDYCAHVLAAVCRPVLDQGGAGGSLILNYRHLPEAMFTVMLPHFGITCSTPERDVMRQTALLDAKVTGLLFAADSEAKQGTATPAVRAAATSHLGEIYAQLECLAGDKNPTSAGGSPASQ